MRGGLIVYTLVAGATALASLTSVGCSLRILDLTSSASVMSIAVLAYNLAFTLMSLVWHFTIGYRLSSRGLLTLSLSIATAGVAMMAFSSNPVIVLAGSGVVGLSVAIVSPVSISVLVEYTGRDSIAAAIYSFWAGVGGVLGYVSGVFISKSITSNVLELATALAAVLSILAVFSPRVIVVLEHRRVSFLSIIPSGTGHLKPLPTVLFSHELISEFWRIARAFKKAFYKSVARKTPLVLLTTLLFFTAVSLFFTPMPAFLRSLGVRDPIIYSLYTLLSITSIATYKYIEKRMSSVESAWRILLSSLASRIALFSIILIAYKLSSGVLLMFLILEFIMLGVTWGGASYSLIAVMLSLSEKGRKSVRIGHQNVMTGAGMILGSLLSTFILKNHGFAITIMLSALFVASSSATAFKAWRAVVA